MSQDFPDIKDKIIPELRNIIFEYAYPLYPNVHNFVSKYFNNRSDLEKEANVLSDIVRVREKDLKDFHTLKSQIKRNGTYALTEKEIKDYMTLYGQSWGTFNS